MRKLDGEAPLASLARGDGPPSAPRAYPTGGSGEDHADLACGPAGAFKRELVLEPRCGALLLCACGQPAKPRQGTRGPHPIRCEPCEAEYQRSMNRAGASAHHKGKGRSLTCDGCSAAFVSRAARGPVRRHCDACRRKSRHQSMGGQHAQT